MENNQTNKKKRTFLETRELQKLNLEQLDKTHLIELLSTILQNDVGLVPEVSKSIDFINSDADSIHAKSM